MENDDKEMKTFNEIGEHVLTTVMGVNMPADYSFKNVSDYVHRADVQFEELEALCLGLATSHDLMKEQVKAVNILLYKATNGGMDYLEKPKRQFMQEEIAKVIEEPTAFADTIIKNKLHCILDNVDRLDFTKFKPKNEA